MFDFFRKKTGDKQHLTERPNMGILHTAADKILKENPKLAFAIATGNEKLDDSNLQVGIYAKVCDAYEKKLFSEVKDSPEYNRTLEECMEIGNSHKNRKISAQAQKLGLREPLQMIEAIKEIVNARISALERQRGKSYEEILEEEIREIKKYI